MPTPLVTKKRWIILCASLTASLGAPLWAQDHATTAPTAVPISATSTQAAAQTATGVGEKIPSEDDLIKNLHSLGLINGHTDIFRCACPVRDLAKNMSGDEPSADDLEQAKVRTQRLYDLGIRTIISFQNASGDGHGHGEPAKDPPGKNNEESHAIALESDAAKAVGIRFVSRPISNSGPDSLETMTDQQVMQLLDSISDEIFEDAKSGGVVFHCSAGHDRTGIEAAYLRLKYEHWPVEQAIAEMRRLGHNWPRFSSDGGVSSWHEQHLRAIAAMLSVQH